MTQKTITKAEALKNLLVENNIDATLGTNKKDARYHLVKVTYPKQIDEALKIATNNGYVVSNTSKTNLRMNNETVLNAQVGNSSQGATPVEENHKGSPKSKKENPKVSDALKIIQVLFKTMTQKETEEFTRALCEQTGIEVMSQENKKLLAKYQKMKTLLG